MPDSVRTRVGRAPTTAPRSLAVGAPRPLAAGVRLQVQRPELVQADHHGRVNGAGLGMPVGDRIGLQHARLLSLEVGVVGGLEGLQTLKGDTLLAQQRAQPLMADVLDHPLGDQEVGQLRQAPRRERQVVVGRARQRDPLHLLALGQRERRRAPTPIARVQRVKAIRVEVVDDVANAISAGEGDLGNPRGIHALSRQQHHLGSPPRHHRAAAPTHDPQQPVALVVADRPHPHPARHDRSSRRPPDSTGFAIHNNDPCRQRGQLCRSR